MDLWERAQRQRRRDVVVRDRARHVFAQRDRHAHVTGERQGDLGGGGRRGGGRDRSPEGSQLTEHPRVLTGSDRDFTICRPDSRMSQH